MQRESFLCILNQVAKDHPQMYLTLLMCALMLLVVLPFKCLLVLNCGPPLLCIPETLEPALQALHLNLLSLPTSLEAPAFLPTVPLDHILQPSEDVELKLQSSLLVELQQLDFLTLLHILLLDAQLLLSTLTDAIFFPLAFLSLLDPMLPQSLLAAMDFHPELLMLDQDVLVTSPFL